MAHNIFHTATDWVNDKVIDPIADYATDKYVDYKIDQYVDSFTDEFKGPTKMTKELEDAGWKLGLDNIPYNPNAGKSPRPEYDIEPNVTPRPGNTGPDFVANNTTASTSPFLSQDLRQRTPSGTIYNPSMEAYNNASIFDYAGPGGVAEYTYGQGLPMDYGVYGTPLGPNLYYEGQFGEGYVEPEVADSAINLPPITMPDGVPQLPTPGNPPTTTPRPTQPNMPAFTGSGSGMDASLLVGQADQGPDIGLLNYTNNGTVSAADQAIFDKAKMSMMPNSGPNIYDTQYTSVPYQIGGEEQVFDGSYNMQPSDDGTFNYGTSQTNQGNFETANQMVGGSLPTNIMRNPNEETQQYRGIYVDPRTVPEIDLVQANQTFMPSFPADYGEGSNLVTITNEPYISDVPIVADDLDNTSIFQDIELPEGPPITVNLNQSYPSDNYSPTPQYGFDEAVVDVYDFITSGNTGNANSGIVQAVAQPATTSGYAGNIIVNPYTIDMSPSEIAYQDAIANPVVQPIVETPIVDTGPDLNSLMQQMSGGTDNEYDYAPYSTGAIDAIVANSILQDQAVASSPAPAPVSIPSIFRPRPTPAPTVFASPGGAPGFTSYGPPNLQLVGGR
tara:strand:- start:1346 stop:3187 length:1842 start_codon:yes stop_codon:yes gene_type:complete